MSIKQNNDSLRVYTKKFTEVMTQVDDLNTEMTLHGYANGFKVDSTFAQHTKSEIIVRTAEQAKLYIQVEESKQANLELDKGLVVDNQNEKDPSTKGKGSTKKKAHTQSKK